MITNIVMKYKNCKIVIDNLTLKYESKSEGFLIPFGRVRFVTLSWSDIGFFGFSCHLKSPYGAATNLPSQ